MFKKLSNANKKNECLQAADTNLEFKDNIVFVLGTLAPIFGFSTEI